MNFLACLFPIIHQQCLDQLKTIESYPTRQHLAQLTSATRTLLTLHPVDDDGSCRICRESRWWPFPRRRVCTIYAAFAHPRPENPHDAHPDTATAAPARPTGQPGPIADELQRRTDSSLSGEAEQGDDAHPSGKSIRDALRAADTRRGGLMHHYLFRASGVSIGLVNDEMIGIYVGEEIDKLRPCGVVLMKEDERRDLFQLLNQLANVETSVDPMITWKANQKR